MKGYDGHSVVVAELVVKAADRAHEARFVSFVWTPPNGIRVPSWGSPVKTIPGGVGGEFPCVLLPKTARNGFADLNGLGQGKGNSSPSLPFVSFVRRQYVQVYRGGMHRSRLTPLSMAAANRLLGFQLCAACLCRGDGDGRCASRHRREVPQSSRVSERRAAFLAG